MHFIADLRALVQSKVWIWKEPADLRSGYCDGNRKVIIHMEWVWKRKAVHPHYLRTTATVSHCLEEHVNKKGWWWGRITENLERKNIELLIQSLHYHTFFDKFTLNLHVKSSYNSYKILIHLKKISLKTKQKKKRRYNAIKPIPTNRCILYISIQYPVQ